MIRTEINNVYIIFKTHLDIGFTDYAANVVENYFENYIPLAIELAGRLRERQGPERFVRTTGSWLIYEFLEKASPTKKAAMEHAIVRGDIAWHGLPFTTHTELMDGNLFKFGLSLSQKLDRRFGKKTIAAKMTDVPGHTRAIIPYLADAGIEYLHIGVNPASTPPDVPSLFRWQSPEDREILINYAGSYGEVQTFNDLDCAQAFAHTGDNCGPPSVDGVKHAFRELRENFPSATIKGATMDEFALRLREISDKLPIIKDELGDTWIHGVGTDPAKVSQFRALSRLAAKWQKTHLDPGKIDLFYRNLLLIPEHTWGMDEKTHLSDYVNYSAKDFREARRKDKVTAEIPDRFNHFAGFALEHETNHQPVVRETNSYSRFERSWQEQRDYITNAVNSLDDLGLRKEAEQTLAETLPRRPDWAGYEMINSRKEIDLPRCRFRLDPATGAIVSLFAKSLSRHIADENHPIGLFSYELFSQECYDRIIREYNVKLDSTAYWAIPDFSKPGIDTTGVTYHKFLPTLQKCGLKTENGMDLLLLELAMGEKECREFGAPKTIFIQYVFTEGMISINIQWFDKPACRLPEASWFSLNPIVKLPEQWQLEKMGMLISPLDVAGKGNRNLHAIDRGVFYRGEEVNLCIESIDAPLVAPGKARLFEFDDSQPPLEQGFHFNLHNNRWGTNFPMWYEEDAQFRFRIVIG